MGYHIFSFQMSQVFCPLKSLLTENIEFEKATKGELE